MADNKEKINEKEMEIPEVDVAEEVTDQEEVSETPEDKAPVARSRAFIMAKYPDKSYDDDEEGYENDLADYLEESDKSLKAYKEADDKLAEILTDYPEMALIVEDLKKGVPFMAALARNVDLDDLEPIEGEPDYEMYAKEREGRREMKRQQQERESALKANAEESAQEILSYLETKGWNEEQRASFDDWFDKLMARLSENHLGKDEMDIFIKGYEYDNAVADAENKGKISGRNEKIETKRKMNENVDDIPESSTTSRQSSAPKQRQVIDINKLLGK